MPIAATNLGVKVRDASYRRIFLGSTSVGEVMKLCSRLILISYKYGTKHFPPLELQDY
jgi:hypothetical protein